MSRLVGMTIQSVNNAELLRVKKNFSDTRVTRVSTTKNSRSCESRDPILRSARAEIESKGILGLRVAEVAKNANCSITQIYRHFDSRDGLLAEVLGNMYQEFLHDSTNRYMATLNQFQSLTVDHIVDNLPSIFDPDVAYRQELRLQVLAASVTNYILHLRLQEITKDQFRIWNEHLDVIESRLAPGVRIDRRVFTMLIASSMPYYRMLMGDVGYTSEEYRQFLKDKLTITIA